MSARLEQIPLFYETGMGLRPIELKELKENSYHIILITDEGRYSLLEKFQRPDIPKLLNTLNRKYNLKEVILYCAENSCSSYELLNRERFN